MTEINTNAVRVTAFNEDSCSADFISIIAEGQFPLVYIITVVLHCYCYLESAVRVSARLDPRAYTKWCGNCRAKHSWWKAISQIIFPTIRECGRVKWRFHMYVCRWGYLLAQTRS